MSKSCLLGAGYCQTPMDERCREPGCDHSRYYCVAKLTPKCYHKGLSQCDYCKWRDNEAKAKMEKEKDMLNESYVLMPDGEGITLAEILDRLLREPEQSKSMKRRNKMYNKAIDDAIKAVKDYYHFRGYTESASWDMVDDLAKLKKTA